MELPKYSGTIHPEEWLKQVKVLCYFKQITNEQEILKICKLMIDSAITISNEINTFDELIKVLKSHSTFNIFKDSCKRKLQVMKYIPEKEKNYTATFLANFRSYCNDAEIKNLEEIKKFLFNTYSSNEFFKNEFIRRIDSTIFVDFNPSNEIIKIFNDVVFDELNIIRYNSLIALRHVSTGKYLSSYEINYQTGSQRQVVFAGENLYNNPRALWVLISYKYHLKESYQQDMVFYNDNFYLKHKETNKIFGISYIYKSPTTKQSEAFCWNNIDDRTKCQFVSKNNYDAFYVKSNDTVNLKTIEDTETEDHFLRSHDFTFTINDEKFQEVVGHTDRIGANDEWCIELIEN
ncbi:hypothetical protein C1645_878104 [Glomus cerebriforme]|uniref:MIR domain-containing protein n=1 Tax=Glomus cerebriforme TaxID=658196 RepID=A0A397SM97_9GLOM|nr:hypothetical protein C1645_878104 [Glomus cerebriforme]